MQNTEKSKIDIIADILRTVLLRIMQEQKNSGIIIANGLDI